jgi:long-chain acyl-CoA synthetase
MAPKTLGGLLLSRAREDPERTFMVWQGREHGRGWLAERAIAYAAALKERGIGRGDRVALLLPNMPEFVVAFLGNALRGAITVPLNPMLKGPEVRYQIEKTRASMLLYAPAFAETVGHVRRAASLRHLVSVGKPPFKDDTFRSLQALDAGASGLAAAADDAQPGDVAAILFTSGTTGNPKGAMLTHANYLANARQLAAHTGMGPADRPLCVLPLFHVNGQVVTVVTPLYSGASMALLPGFSKETFLPAVAAARATSFSAVPTIYALLMTLPDRDKHDLSSLRYCICGAAPMPVELFQRFQEAFRTKILEGYGLTEGTCASCVNPVDGPRKVGTIGIALGGQEVRLVDDGGAEVPAGAVGEIAVRGDNVMAGYYEDPEATAQAIRGGWLHTGDMATRDADGYFTIVGRKKEMIIRGGENIYPKEIEEVVYQAPGVLEAAVVGVPDPVWGEVVALFVVPRPGTEVAEDGLRRFLSERLADYKLPRHVVFREALPKTATGKIRKGELRDTMVPAHGPTSSPAPPRGTPA